MARRNNFKPQGTTIKGKRGFTFFGAIDKEKGTQFQKFTPFSRIERLKTPAPTPTAVGPQVTTLDKPVPEALAPIPSGQAAPPAPGAPPSRQSGFRGDQPNIFDRAPLTQAPQVSATVTPTPEEPIKTIGATDTGIDFSTLSDQEKFIEIGLKRSKGQSLTDDETRFLIAQQLQPPDPVDISGILEEIEAQRAQLTAELGAAEADKKIERDKLIAEEDIRRGARTAAEEAKIQAAGTKTREAVQTALSFSGFGRSTFNADRQAEIQQKVGENQKLVRDAAALEASLFKRALEGEDEASLQPLRDQIISLRGAATQASIDAAFKTAELNAVNKVTGLEAINNMLEALGGVESEPFNKELTDTINDGFLYTVDENGVPQRVTNGFGVFIKTGVNDEGKSDLVFSAPKMDIFGNVVSPAYIFDKSTGELQMIDPSTGERTTIMSGEEAFDAINTFKNFEEYTSSTGNGTVIKGSQYHSGFEVDIDGDIGDPIGSFVNGKVKTIDAAGNGGFGKNVVVEMEDGTTIRYAHLDSISVKPGQDIFAGMHLGNMGNTGNVIPLGGGDGSHLHIEGRDANDNLIALSSISSSSTLGRSTGTDLPSSVYQLEANSLAISGAIKPEAMGLYVQQREAGLTQEEILNKNLDTKQKIDLELKMANDFERFIKEARSGSAQVVRIEAAFEQAKVAMAAGTSINAASQGVLVSFQKLLDPTSVVRESEYARSGAGLSLISRIEGFATKITQGGAGVTVDDLEEFVIVGKEFYKGYEVAMLNFAQRTQTQAGNYGLNLENILTPDLISLLDAGPQITLAPPTPKLEAAAQTIADRLGFDVQGALDAGATLEDIEEFLLKQ